MADMVNHPAHYKNVAVTIQAEPIDLLCDFDFLLGNAFKYLFRYQFKGKPLEDLQKAEFYLKRALKRKKFKRYKPILNRSNLIFVSFVDHADFLSAWDFNLSIKDNLLFILKWIYNQQTKYA